MGKPDYDTTLARIAGNIAAGMVDGDLMYATEEGIRDRRRCLGEVGAGHHR